MTDKLTETARQHAEGGAIANETIQSTWKVTAEQAREALELLPSRWTLVGDTFERLEYATLVAYIAQTESAIAERKVTTLTDALRALEEYALAGVTLGTDDSERLHATVNRIAPIAERNVPECVHVVCKWKGDTCEFVECELDNGRSVYIEWHKRLDRYHELRLFRMTTAPKVTP